MEQITVDIQTKPNAYGFGKDWSLVLKKDGKIIDSKYLGQDVKVSQRVLGIRDAMAHYASKFRENNPGFEGVVRFQQVSEMIAEDLLLAMTGARYEHEVGRYVGGIELTDENLEELADKPSWAMAVE